MKMLVKLKTDYLNVEILHFDSPFSFFCRIRDNKPLVADEISRFIKLIFHDNAPRTKDVANFQYGEMCAVKCNDAWARAFRMETEDVWLPDHAKTLPLEGLTVYELPYSKMASIPSDVFHCALGKISPLKVVWEANSSKFICEASGDWEKPSLNFARSQIIKSSSVQFKARKVTRVDSSHNLMVLGDAILDIDGRQISLTQELINKCFALKDPMSDENYQENLFPYRCIYDPNESREMNIFKQLITEDVAFKLDFLPCSEFINPKILHSKLEGSLVGKIEINSDGTAYNLLDVEKKKIVKYNTCQAYVNYDEKCIGRACKRLVDAKSVITDVSEPDYGTVDHLVVDNSVVEPDNVTANSPDPDEDSWSD